MKRLSLVVLIVSAACSHPTQVKSTASVAPAPAAHAGPVAKATPVSPSVAVGDSLAKQCELRLGNPQAAPKFDYDTSELAPADRDVLQQIATCVTTGPLKGKKLELTGRADPRGTEEYNLGLGSRRAGSVKTFLQRLGVGDGQLGETTRGALDANGTDENGWSTDRRVDITVGG
jgi:outer membrane protein OmpA-like peptidoglycan-associated protein